MSTLVRPSISVEFDTFTSHITDSGVIVSDKRLECFTHLLKNMRVLPDEELENVTHFYFKETKIM